MVRVTFDRGDKVRRWERGLANPKNALKQIGAMMVAESQQAFKAQRFGNVEWEPRAPVNVFGIIADFHQGRRKPVARRFERRPALRDTGQLARSIAFHVAGNVVEVGSNLPYAALHHHGSPPQAESKPLTAKVRRALWRWLKAEEPDGPGPLTKRLGWLLNRHAFPDGTTLKMDVPRRPIVGITRQTRKDIFETIGVRIMEVR